MCRADLNRLIDNHGPEVILGYLGMQNYFQYIVTPAHLALEDGPSNLQAKIGIGTSSLGLESRGLVSVNQQGSQGEYGVPEISLKTKFADQPNPANRD